ncbi:MAG: efflux RND transporter periplasmic adaptor subunit [Saprospiraceae bacterium]
MRKRVSDSIFVRSFCSAFPLTVICILLLSACHKEAKPTENKGKGAGNSPTSAVVFVASKQALSTPIEVQGTIVAKEFVEIRPEINGRLTYENIQDGAQVSAGTILARINADDLRAQDSKLRSQLTIAKQNLDRVEQLLGRNGASQLELDNAKNQANILQADIQLNNVALSKTIIRAPFSGRLGFKLISKGAYVSPSTLLTTLTQVNPLWVEFIVPERYIANIKIGQEVKVNMPDQGTPVDAVIKALDPNIDAGSRSLSVRAQLKSVPVGTQPGVSAKVQYILNQQSDAILIPSQCIIPEVRGKKVILIKNGIATPSMVETGWRDEKRVQILSGVQSGDTILATSIMQIRPDMPVRISGVIQ